MPYKCDEGENRRPFPLACAALPLPCWVGASRPEGTRPYIQQMPRTWRMTQVGKRKIELSNLEKVLCPEDGVLKVACRGTERQATH